MRANHRISARPRARFRITIVPAMKVADIAGRAASEVASGLISANGMKTSVWTGGQMKPIAASFGGSFHQTK